MIITNVTGNYFLKQNDTATEIILSVQEVDGTPVDLTTAVRVEVVIGSLLGRMLVKDATVLSVPGELSFSLDEGDALPAGDNLLEVHISTSSNEKRVAPSKGHYKLRVDRAIDNVNLQVTTYTLDYFLAEVNRITYGLPALVVEGSEMVQQLSDSLVESESLHVQSVETLNRANIAANKVEGASQRAETAASEAQLARDEALSSALEANNATANAIDATTEAYLKAASAESAKQEAQTAAQLANEAKTAADSATLRASNAANAANTAASGIEGYNIPITDFSLVNKYIRNQPARSNGSTYRAKVETQGNPLPVFPAIENTWWTLEAQRGTDGQGAVSTVNGIMPDPEGNIELPHTEIEVSSTESPNLNIGSLWFDLGEQTDRGGGGFVLGNGVLSDSEPTDTDAIWLDSNNT